MSIKRRVSRIEEYLKRKGESEDPIKDFYQNSMVKGSKYKNIYAHPIASAFGYHDKEKFLIEYPEKLRQHLWDLCGEALNQIDQEVDIASLSGELTPEKLKGQICECFKIGVGLDRLKSGGVTEGNEK